METVDMLTHSLVLGHAPDAETQLTILTIASSINPRAFRDPVNGLTTPFEVRAFRAGMLKALPGRDPYRRETRDGELPTDRRGDRKKPRKPRLSARVLEVHAAKVAFTNEERDPRYMPRRLKRALGLEGNEKAMQEERRRWSLRMQAAIPAAPELDAD